MDAENNLVREYEGIIKTMRHQIAVLKTKVVGRHSMPARASPHVSAEYEEKTVKIPTALAVAKGSTLRGCSPRCTETAEGKPSITFDLRSVKAGATQAGSAGGGKRDKRELQARVDHLEKENKALRERVEMLEKGRSEETVEMRKQLADKDRAIEHLLAYFEAPIQKTEALAEVRKELERDLSPRSSVVKQRLRSARRTLSQCSARKSADDLHKKQHSVGENEQLLTSIKAELGAASKQVQEIVAKSHRRCR